MEGEKNLSRYTAVINGREYNLISEKPEEHLKTIVEYTKLRLEEVAQRPSAAIGTPATQAIITSLNIAEDYIDLKAEYEKIKSEVDKIKTEMFRHNNAVKENERMIEMLKAENAKLRMTIQQKGGNNRPKGQY